MQRKKQLLTISLLTMIVAGIIYACNTVKPQNGETDIVSPKSRVLVFTKTKGYYHESIPTGSAALIKLGREQGFRADTTADASYFSEDSLRNYHAVIFLNTTMDVLNADQQVAFERYIQAGGGFMGIHAATDTEYEWPWYNKLVGAYFASHPKQQRAVIRITDKNHPSTSFLPDQWERFDEWYNFKAVQPDLNVVAYLDESTYEGGEMGDRHPFAWYHEFDGGRAFYTAGGHTHESYSDTLFLKHLLGGIRYAIGEGKALDFSKSYSVKAPEENRFIKTVLTDDLNEPMELTVASDGTVYFTERRGRLYAYLPSEKKTRLLHTFDIKGVGKYKNGLIGITLDPEFDRNRWLYVFYCDSTKGQLHQNVSRFVVDQQQQLNIASEQIIIKIPIDGEISAHTGGSLAWDNQQNLYISTGDNTVPFESDGYAPIDERDGRKVFDAQRSSANTNDLRGKILRIHPEDDGTYTIPEGNLFAKGMANTRPEIYVMGCRNPYRISVDPKTSFVYWGEIGPDAGEDSRHGPRGFDEINQARQAGNFGWPYFVGNNAAYHDSSFSTGTIGDVFSVSGPQNLSPNNTGNKLLPAPQPAFIWYPYNLSDEFPYLGVGGRCAMSGPVFHYQSRYSTTGGLPEYFDQSLFIYDWMRNWVFAVRMNDQQQFKRLEPFMPVTGDFRRPVDLEFGPDGSMYLLEYGSVYGIDNVDARLVRITYNPGNRKPRAVITAKDSTGHVPLQLKISGEKSVDDDNDRLNYEWTVNGLQAGNTSLLTHTFGEKGSYQVVLRVVDPSGMDDRDTLTVVAGNTAPIVLIETDENSSFYFQQPQVFSYVVSVNDAEESSPDAKAIETTLTYLPRVGNLKQGHQLLSADSDFGKTLIASSDCKACHQISDKSVGPAFMEISKKYAADKNAPGYLANKIIAGGGGVWGPYAMSAHPQLSKEEASQMVQYILSLSTEKKEQKLAPAGGVRLDEHVGKDQEGYYLLEARYTDGGNGAAPLSGRKQLILRPAKVLAGQTDRQYNLSGRGDRVTDIRDGSYLLMKAVDLRQISAITVRMAPADTGTIELRTGGVRGPLLGSSEYAPAKGDEKYQEIRIPIAGAGNRNDLFIVFRRAGNPKVDEGRVDWLRMERS